MQKINKPMYISDIMLEAEELKQLAYDRAEAMLIAKGEVRTLIPYRTDIRKDRVYVEFKYHKDTSGRVVLIELTAEELSENEEGWLKRISSPTSNGEVYRVVPVFKEILQAH